MLSHVGCVLLVAGLLVGCGESSAPPPVTAPGPTAQAALRQEGDALAAQGDYSAAAERYREALRIEPENLVLRFSLGAALSHLGKRDEAIEQFRWVVERGSRDRPEVETARQWLLKVGVWQQNPMGSPPVSAPLSHQEPVAQTPHGIVKGNTVWPGVNSDTFRLNLQILLEGEDPLTRGKRLLARTMLGEPYAVQKVPQGTYRLMAQVGAVRLWETQVNVKAGKETVLDLTPATSLISPRDFPQHR